MDKTIREYIKDAISRLNDISIRIKDEDLHIDLKCSVDSTLVSLDLAISKLNDIQNLNTILSYIEQTKKK